MKKSYKKLIHKMLKDIGDGHTPKYNNYSISKECFEDVVNYIKRKDLARGMGVVRRNKENKVTIAGCMNPYLTSNGVNYLDKSL